MRGHAGYRSQQQHGQHIGVRHGAVHQSQTMSPSATSWLSIPPAATTPPRAAGAKGAGCARATGGRGAKRTGPQAAASVGITAPNAAHRCGRPVDLRRQFWWRQRKHQATESEVADQLVTTATTMMRATCCARKPARAYSRSFIASAPTSEPKFRLNARSTPQRYRACVVPTADGRSRGAPPSHSC